MILEELQAENEKLKKRVMEQDALIRQQAVQIENMLQAYPSCPQGTFWRQNRSFHPRAAQPFYG